MLWTVSAGGSGWLDRLRSARGFSEAAASDLENFPRNPGYQNSGTSETNLDSDPKLVSNRGDDDKQVSGVLQELFNFGENRNNSTANLKKSIRKQANPRICASSKNETGGNNDEALDMAMVPSNGDDSVGVEGVKMLSERGNEGVEEGRLSGFSRTEVTVIDTSYDQWKFDKLLYRKKNVWKVRDKKGKSEHVGSKRKWELKTGVEQDQWKKKKHKIDQKSGGGEEGKLLFNKICMCTNYQSNKSEAHGKAPVTVAMILKMKQANLKLKDVSLSDATRSIQNQKKAHPQKMSES